MLTLRTGTLALVCAAIAVSACTRSNPTSTRTLGRGSSGAALELATFTGTFDPATGELKLATAPSSDPAALSAIPDWKDGVNGSNPDNTLELRTLRLSEGGSYGVAATGCSDLSRSYHGVIRLQSFFRNQTFTNVHAEIISVSDYGNRGCNSDATVPTGLSNELGLWDYGSLGWDGSSVTSSYADRDWHFRSAGDTPFTFVGRIMGTLSAPVFLATDFDWTPTSLVNPPRSFEPVDTTLSYLVWDGTEFVDWVGTITFDQAGGTVSSSSNGLMDPFQPYADFTGGGYFVETAAGGGVASRLDLSGGFTVCAKIKPGVSPAAGVLKTIVAKGNPDAAGTIDLGFAMEQGRDEYYFDYRTPTSVALNWVYTGSGANPEAYAYDYVCGGRGGPGNLRLWVSAHGYGERTFATDQTGAFDGPALPIAIGATSDGAHLAGDVGVYEIIFDSRPATVDVMRDIVGRAEGGVLPGSQNFSATYVATIDVPRSFVGANGSTFTLPPYATFPVTADGSGLLNEGVYQLSYTHPLATNTSTTGFCLNAEIVATGPWANATGTFAALGGAPEVRIHVSPFDWINDGGDVVAYGLPGTWLDGSAHTFHACAEPGTPALAKLYLDYDPTPVTTGSIGAVFPNLASPDAKLGIGSELPGQYVGGGGGPLTGARIRRLFICPDPSPANCP